MHRTIEWFAWWIVLLALWLATASTVTVAEVAVAAGAAGACAVLARLVRRAMGLRFAAPMAPLKWSALVPIGAVLDLWRLIGWLLQGAPEKDREQRFASVQLPEGKCPDAVVRRAASVLAISATPGTVVVDADPVSGTALVHPLVTGWPDLDERVSR